MAHASPASVLVGGRKRGLTASAQPVAWSSAGSLAQSACDLASCRAPATPGSNYQQQRDAVTENGFELTLRTSRLAPLSARLETPCREASHRPELARQVFGVLAGTIPIRDVFAGDRH
jgi:hypothetical protein